MISLFVKDHNTKISFFSHAVDLKIIKSSSLLPAAKPTGHRTVKVVVVVGGLH